MDISAILLVIAKSLKPLGDILGLIFFAFFGGIVRTIYRPRARHISAYVTSIIISIPIGVLAGNFALEFGLSDTASKGFAVVAGILAHDIIESVFWTADKIKLEREAIWKVFWARLTGKKK